MSHLTVIQIPKRVNWEGYVSQESDQWEWQVLLSNLFDERPIWPKESLTERLLDKGLTFTVEMFRRYPLETSPFVVKFFSGLIEDDLIWEFRGTGMNLIFGSDLLAFVWSCRLLSRIAYYFSSGPFLRFWIRKGYDPRKDSDSRM